jgi:hypothetical protein
VGALLGLDSGSLRFFKNGGLVWRVHGVFFSVPFDGL